jgi:hypothetical protein
VLAIRVALRGGEDLGTVAVRDALKNRELKLKNLKPASNGDKSR